MRNSEIFDNTIREMATLLGIDKGEMYDMVLDNARAWLMEWTGDRTAAEVWEATPEFWVWWRSLWLDTDLLHLDRLSKLDLLEIRMHGDGMEQYRRWHDPRLICTSPNSAVYESFHRLVKHMAGACEKAMSFII